MIKFLVSADGPWIQLEKSDDGQYCIVAQGTNYEQNWDIADEIVERPERVGMVVPMNQFSRFSAFIQSEEADQ